MAKKILLVEDDDNISRIIELRLEAEGYKTAVANNGEDGWKKAKSEKPDLIILDIELPIVDGLTVCDMIRKNKDTKNIPVIMLTAKDKMLDLEKGFLAGADMYLNKPYVWERLLENVKKFIK